MNLEAVMADLRATRRCPLAAEAELIAREGSLDQVGEALGNSCGLNDVLRRRYAELRRSVP